MLFNRWMFDSAICSRPNATSSIYYSPSLSGPALLVELCANKVLFACDAAIHNNTKSLLLLCLKEMKEFQTKTKKKLHI